MATPKKSLAVEGYKSSKKVITFGFPIDPEFNRPKLATDREEFKQAIALRLWEAKGDWFFDRDLGLPWITRKEFGVFGILGSKPPLSPQLIEAFIRDELSKEPRIQTTRDYNIEIDNAARKVTVDFNVVPIDEDPFRLEIAI